MRKGERVMHCWEDTGASDPTDTGLPDLPTLPELPDLPGPDVS
jgi:hypothetical protein